MEREGEGRNSDKGLERQACPFTRLLSGASSQQCCSLAVARRISAFLCRQACPSTRLFSGLIAQRDGSSGLKAGTASVSFVVCSDVYR